MIPAGVPPGISVSYLEPPYTLAVPLHSSNDLRLAHPAIGTLLTLSPRHDALRDGSLERAVGALRAHYPAVPLVLCVERASPDQAMAIGLRAQRLRFRAVLIATDPSYRTLRPLLTAPPDLGAEVVEWLGLRGTRLLPQLANFVREAFRQAGKGECLTALLRDSRCPARTARAQCRKLGAVSPGQWFQLARATQAALQLQRDPGKALLRVALELGYHDQSGLIHQLERHFGFRPTAVRQLLGWECLLDRWVERSARHAIERCAGVGVGITCRIEHRREELASASSPAVYQSGDTNSLHEKRPWHPTR